MRREDEPKDEPRVFMRHARQVGYCSNGSERVSERFGVPYRQFLKEGYPVSKIKDTNNPLVRKIIRLALAEWDEGNNHG